MQCLNVVKLMVLLGAVLLIRPVYGNDYAVPEGMTRFAVIGDFGYYSRNAVKVADLVKRWQPEFIITTGDNNYRSGRQTTIDQNIGKLYHNYIHPYKGTFGIGAERNRFFPTLGNHDVRSGKKAYFDYFNLPGYEQYYDFIWGPVHFFTVDSTDVISSADVANTKQILWLELKIQNSKKPWKILYMHYPPYTSGKHRSYLSLRLPYHEWGATAVLTGHNHSYERIMVDGIPYMVNGLGGKSIYKFFGEELKGTAVRYNKNYGAMIVDANYECIVYRFININDEIIDSYEMCK